MLSNGKDKLARWAEHFCEVLNRPAPAIPAQVKDPWDPLSINTEKFTMEEVRKSIKTPKNRTSNMDGFSTEMMKVGGEMVVEWMCGL